MLRLLAQLRRDENGFVVSAELTLVATICVISMIVGLSEISNGVNEELEDVGSAIGSVNQGYAYAGAFGHKGVKVGSFFRDHKDDCDGQFDITCNLAPQPETPKHTHR